MKKIGIITGTLISIFFLLFFVFTPPVNHTPYFETDYFNNSLRQIDSLKNLSSHVNDKLSAGFSKVSITPNFNQAEENYEEGKFKQIPLAGYGARKGAPATGIHDSIFVKAAALKMSEELVVFVSADYPGFWSRKMENTSVDFALFFAGSMGSQSPVSKGEGFEKAKFLDEYEPKTMGWFGPYMGDYTMNLIRQLTEIVTTN